MMNYSTVWGIHAGAQGEADNLFLKTPCVALGWDKVGDLSKIVNDREAFKTALMSGHPETKPGAVATTAGMLYRFIYEIQIGDYILYPSKRDKSIHLGEITGSYEYRPDLSREYPNIRTVKWLKSVPRTEISQGALYEIGSAMSLFQVKNYADEYIGVLNGEKKTQEKDDEEDSTVADTAKNIEENTRDFVYKKLSKELKGHPFEHFVAHLLNLMGYKTRVSPEGGDGGIDVLAFKDELGIEPPIIKVQVKSEDGNITPDKVQALYGNVETGEYGLFITLGSYSKNARSFAKSKSNLRLIDGDELIDLILSHYEQLDSKYKAMLPLKNVYIPTQIED
jgi:restriction system protein